MLSNVRVLGTRLMACLVLACARDANSISPDRELTQLSVRRLGLEEGLPTVAVQAIERATDGTLWIGTAEGLVKFDGFDVEVFDRRNTKAFGSNEIRSLRFDSEGTLWIGMADGWLCRMKGRDIERVRRLSGTVTLTSLRGGVIAMDNGRAAFPVGPPQKRVQALCAAIANEDVQAVLEAAEGDVWVATRGGEFLSRYRDGVRTPVGLPEEALPRDPVLSLSADGKGGVWTTFGRGLHHITEAGITSRFVDDAPRGPLGPLIVDQHGCAWAGYISGGGLIRQCGDRLERLDVSRGFPSERIVALAQDDDGSVWIATWDSGLLHLTDGPFSAIGTRQGLPSDNVFTFLQASDGALWIGGHEGVCRREESGRLTCFGRREGLDDLRVRSLEEVRGGRILIGTHTGLYSLDVASGRAKSWRPESLGRTRGLDTVWGLFRDRRGEVWAGIGDTTPTVAVLAGDESRLASGLEAPAYAFTEDLAGDVWAATNHGILRFDRKESAWKLLQDTTAGRIFMAAFTDPAGRLWFGSYQGGLLVGMPGGPFRTVTTQDGLPDDNVLGIVADDTGRLWITGGRQLTSIEPGIIEAFLGGRQKTLQCRTWGRRHGLKTMELHGGSGIPILRTREGRIWVATSAGAVSVDPRDLKEEPPPVAQLTRIALDGLAKDPASALEVPAGLHRVELVWSARHRVEPESVRFRRRLTGWDEGWVTDTGSRKADYVRLPPGRYRFEVEASFDGASWGPAGVLEVGVGAHWYERRGSWIVILAALGVAGASAFRLRLAKAKARADRFEVLVAERSQSLARAESELRRQREMEPLVVFGRRISGVLDPEEVLREAETALVRRVGTVPFLLVARREGSPAVVRSAREKPSEREVSDLLAHLQERWSGGPAVLPVDDATVDTRALFGGLRFIAPLRSGASIFGVLASASPAEGDDEGLDQFLEALAAQTANALEGAWQAAEAARWRQVSDARVEWLALDPVCRVVYAAMARLEVDARKTELEVVRAVLEAFGSQAPRREVVVSAVERLSEAGILEKLPDDTLTLLSGDWLLLPELKSPLTELAVQAQMRVGAFRLVERIGAGGMGEVFRAVNVHDGSPAAVKLLYVNDSQDPEARRRLEREGEIVASIHHPNVVRFLERGEHAGRLYLAMELLDGEPLGRLFERGPLSMTGAKSLARQLFSAIGELHQRSLVHRDVNPSNIFHCPEGRYVLLDMGLARGIDHTTLTRTRQVMGTLPYMSPEQLRGEDVDARSDLWSAAVVLFEAVSGRLPWRGPNTVRMALEILSVKSEVSVEDLPEDAPLRSILEQCLEPQADRRPASALDVLRMLDEERGG